MQSPNKVVQSGSSGISSASVLLEHEYMPLYVPSPSSRGSSHSSGRSSGSTGQLMRIWFAIPKDTNQVVTIKPLVTPGRNAPTFKTTPDEIELTSNSIWVLRLPFIYQDEHTIYYPPKGTVYFINY